MGMANRDGNTLHDLKMLSFFDLFVVCSKWAWDFQSACELFEEGLTQLENSSNKMKFKSSRLSSILYYQCVTKIKQP